MTDTNGLLDSFVYAGGGVGATDSRLVLASGACVNAAANDEELGRICWLGSMAVDGNEGACTGTLESTTFRLRARFEDFIYGGGGGEACEGAG